MRTVITLNNEHGTHLPMEFAGQDVRMADALPARFIQEYTRPDDCVLDPFAGYGTTVRMAESMGRAGWGIEPMERRAAYARSRLSHPERLLDGSVFDLESYALPKFDFVFCSPPFMAKADPVNPLVPKENGANAYGRYLERLVEAFRLVKTVLKPGARVAVEVSNLALPEGTTFLAFDCIREISRVLHLEHEVIISWEPTYGYGYDHSYCIVFVNKPL